MKIIRVRSVKKEINPNAIFENRLILNPLRIATPTMNSAVESNMALGMEMKSINPRWKAPRYSFIFRALPIGSIALRNPESTNRIPNRKRHMASKNFIPTAFSSEQLLYLFPYIGKYICRRKHFPFCILTMNPYKTVIGPGLFKIHLPYMDLEPDIGLMNVLLAV